MWRFAAAKATGTSHARAGLPCQDSFACDQTGAGYLLCALADGAGSASLSQRGAELAVQTAIRAISSRCLQEDSDLTQIIRDAAIQARNAIQSIARRESISPREFACTLLLAIVGPSSGAAAQIGDGVIVARDGEGAWCWVFWPQHGEFVNTTRFITDDDALIYLQVESLPHTIEDVILLTDGLERLALDMAAQTTHDPFFTGLVTPLILTEGTGEMNHLSERLESFLLSERVSTRTDDDVSLILATRHPSDPRP